MNILNWNGEKFKAWRDENYPGGLVLPIGRACGDHTVEDLTVEDNILY